MPKVTLAFYYSNQIEIDSRASKVAPPPFASPLYGAGGIAFGAAIVAMLTLGLAGTEFSEHRQEGIMTIVALICATISYLFLRSQEKAFWREVDRECEAMWIRQQPKTDEV